MKAYKFTMTPVDTAEVVQYLIVDDEYAAEYIEVDAFEADEFFNELDNGRHPGHELKDWEDADLEEAKQSSPYTIG
jgi:hypothetical protein